MLYTFQFISHSTLFDVQAVDHAEATHSRMFELERSNSELTTQIRRLAAANNEMAAQLTEEVGQATGNWKRDGGVCSDNRATEVRMLFVSEGSA